MNTDTRKLTIGEMEPPITSVVHKQADGPEILILATERFELAEGAILHVEGRRPLAIVSAGDIVVRGLLDAGADLDVAGPGADPEGCGLGSDGQRQVARSNLRAAGSGGGGGGYGSVGGAGARVATSKDGDRIGGAVTGTTAIIPLRGGCRGGRGGDSVEGEGSGLPGAGGGAVQLVAAGTLTIEGPARITTSGGGGGGALRDNAGGGGGGSGGAILLEGNRVIVRGRLTANGGGGGEGFHTDDVDGDISSGAPGANGSIDSADPAIGGSGRSDKSGDGGAGAAGDLAAGAGLEGVAGQGMELTGGSGGGGGGVGRIFLRSHVDALDVDGSLISPPPVTGGE